MTENGADPAPPSPGGDGEDVEQQGEEWARERQAGAMLPVLSILTSLTGLNARTEQHVVDTAARDALRPRQALVLESLLTGKTQTEAAKEHQVGLRSIQRWVAEDPTFKEALREGMADLRASTKPLMVDGFRRGVMRLIELTDHGSAKIALGAAATLAKLYRPEGVQTLTQETYGDEDHDAAWDRAYTQRGHAFLPHDKQLQAINSIARYLVLVAGVQSGKTDTGAINFWRRIKEEDDPTAVYWMVAPDTTIGAVMRKRFVSRAPKGWLVDPSGHGQEFNRWWKLKNGATVQFRSADRPTKLVAETLRGVWMDEFTLMRGSVWQVSLRARLATTGGWAIFTGTPRGPNWGHEVWRRTQPGDDLYDPTGEWNGFTWHSAENPLITQAEVDDAKRTLPDAFYRREWEASWEAFHGQVFQHFSKRQDVWNLTKELTRKRDGDLIDVGVDWGWAKAGAMVVGRWNDQGTWDILEEVHEAKKLPPWWVDRAKELHRRFGVNTFWCDGAEPDRVVGLRKALRTWAKEEGLSVPRVKSAKKQVWPGIRHLAKLFKSHSVRVHRACEVVVTQLTGYKFKEDRDGDDTEEVDKKNDHTVDAIRYMVFSRTKAGRRRGEITVGS